MSKSQTLYEKIWNAHIVRWDDDGASLLYIDRHLIHEVTTPQAFEGLRAAGRPVRRPDLTLAVPDHNVPTVRRGEDIADERSAAQVAMLESNCREFGIEHIGMNDPAQGIVHVIGPEQGFTLPGATLVCGDSHTSTHGAFGALAFGIGTSEVEHVLATQTLPNRPSKTMLVQIDGRLGFSVTAKDVVLSLIGEIGAGAANGYVVEYAGSTIDNMSMEERMTICNMSIEFGARAGLIAPDEITFAYLEGRPRAPRGEQWKKAVAFWKTLHTDKGAEFNKTVSFDAEKIEPVVTWGTSPEDVLPITASAPDPRDAENDRKRAAIQKALDYMGLTPGQCLEDISIDRVFVGSCTNSRIEDLRSAAAVVRGKRVANSVKQALVVPGSGVVKRQAEDEGLDAIFREAGFEWREPGCSMCLAMNDDKVPAGERCASTSNRNFMGRQGPGARTHLMSPAMAAAAALTGRLTDVRQLASSGRG